MHVKRQMEVSFCDAPGCKSAASSSCDICGCDICSKHMTKLDLVFDESHSLQSAHGSSTMAKSVKRGEICSECVQALLELGEEIFPALGPMLHRPS